MRNVYQSRRVAVTLSYFEGLGMEHCHGSHGKAWNMRWAPWQNGAHRKGLWRNVMAAMAKRQYKPWKESFQGCMVLHNDESSCFAVMNRHDPAWWIILINHHDSQWWIIMIHHDASSWFIVMNDHDSSWWIMIVHHDASSWFILMNHHDSSWWVVVIHHHESGCLIGMNHHSASSIVNHDDSAWRITTNHDDSSLLSTVRPERIPFRVLMFCLL